LAEPAGSKERNVLATQHTKGIKSRFSFVAMNPAKQVAEAIEPEEGSNAHDQNQQTEVGPVGGNPRANPSFPVSEHQDKKDNARKPD
jgi:hypothetical protein